MRMRVRSGTRRKRSEATERNRERPDVLVKTSVAGSQHHCPAADGAVVSRVMVVMDVMVMVELNARARLVVCPSHTGHAAWELGGLGGDRRGRGLREPARRI